MAHWKKRGIFMVENQVFRRAGGSIGTIWRMWKNMKKCEQNGWKVLTNCVKRNTVIVLNSGISGVTRPKFIHVWEYKYRHD